MSVLDIEFTVTLGRLIYPYLALVGSQFIGVTYAYLYGRGKDSFRNAFINATILGTVLAYIVLVFSG